MERDGISEVTGSQDGSKKYETARRPVGNFCKTGNFRKAKDDHRISTPRDMSCYCSLIGTFSMASLRLLEADGRK